MIAKKKRSLNAYHPFDAAPQSTFDADSTKSKIPSTFEHRFAGNAAQRF